MLTLAGLQLIPHDSITYGALMSKEGMLEVKAGRAYLQEEPWQWHLFDS
jgi:hypothetical protein